MLGSKKNLSFSPNLRWNLTPTRAVRLRGWALKGMGYSKAYGFVENARDQLYTYVTDWLKTDASNPRVTSLIERVMREIKRRIKKIGSGWSEKGAERMTRLVLLRLSRTQHQWEEHWKNQMGTDANLKLTFLGVTVQN